MTVLKRSAFLLVCAAALSFAADPGLLSLTPPEAKLLIGINAEQAKNTPFGRNMLGRLQKEDAGFAAFISTTGFDPRRDLREVLIASTGNHSEGGLVVAKGFFNGARISEFARQHGAEMSNFQGVDIISGGRGNKGAFAILDSTTAVGGDLDSVRAAISRREKPVTLSAALLSKINTLSSENDAWFTSTLSASELASRVPDSRAAGIAKGDILQAVEQSSGGVKFGDMVQISGEALMRSDKDATALADVARFLGSMVQVNRDKEGAARIATLLDQMVIRTEANVVKFSVAVPQQELERMIAPRPRRAAQL